MKVPISSSIPLTYKQTSKEGNLEKRLESHFVVSPCFKTEGLRKKNKPISLQLIYSLTVTNHKKGESKLAVQNQLF